MALTETHKGYHEKMTAAPGEDLSPALALVNTRHRDGDDLPSWLADQTLADSEHDRFQRLREVVRELFLARTESRQPAPSALSELDDVLRVAPGTPALTWAEPPHREWRWLGGTKAERTAAAIAADAIDVLTARGEALAQCPAPGCVKLLLRTHRRRHWCSTRCGDRVRADRHYHRQRP
ncbi:Conserved protein containing a Zn-ribbon-like motif, possibly RNA-binding [Amycolatopsis marina]|uniref:Conserved protein containing a Zn-ribbon-like motif, possibly RNA-binding n=2 Tax=Amycolatopsis marina TaxID=490629 RepID=A0A1I0YR59_9PSEU|nr:Conserved protein containing a Zn-ribbon-like motif, possibly RNA-binding [Amycolatopsis marina]